MSLGSTQLIVIAAALAVAGPAAAQIESREGIALQNQILELRRDVEALRDQLARGGGGYPPPRQLSPAPVGGGNELTAQLLQRVQTLEDQLRQVRGQADRAANETTRQGQDLSKQIGDLSFRVQQIEGGARAAPRAAPAAAPERPAAEKPAPERSASALTAPLTPPGFQPAPLPPPLAGPVRRTPELAIQDGNAALARRDYASAEAAAREVLSGSRASPRAYDAQFLLAQALSGQRNYPQAAIAYDDAYSRAKTGARAPEALVGLASSLTSIGEKRAACETLTKLNAEFPRLRTDLRDVALATRTRAGCG